MPEPKALQSPCSPILLPKERKKWRYRPPRNNDVIRTAEVEAILNDISFELFFPLSPPFLVSLFKISSALVSSGCFCASRQGFLSPYNFSSIKIDRTAVFFSFLLGVYLVSHCSNLLFIFGNISRLYLFLCKFRLKCQWVLLFAFPVFTFTTCKWAPCGVVPS